MFDIEEVLKKADLLEYVRRAGGELKGGSNRYSCACVLHGGDNPTALSVYYKDGKWLWNCFTGLCGGGDAIRFVELWQNLDFKRACEWINGGAIQDSEGMVESAKRRHEQAVIEAQAALEREKARRHELQLEEKHLYYHRTMTDFHREQWRKAGIEDEYQEMWTLGGCNDFEYSYDGKVYHTPTLTIPKFGEENELLTIEHRLLNPQNPKDKYRPECVGLHAHPFLALPFLGYDGDKILVMEGAKKAMVAWTRIKGGEIMQTIGVPSQEGYKALFDKLKPRGRDVIVIPDPDTDSNPNAIKKGMALAKEVGGSILRVPLQIDDLILSAGITVNQFHSMLKQARKV